MNFKQKVLEYLSLDENQINEYLKPLEELDYGSPSDFIDMDKAVTLVTESIENDYKTMIYGDYDADGIMATSIIVNLYAKFNKTPGYYIPSRTIDGYGINLDRAKQIVAKGYKLVITVDNGVSQFEALSYLKENGVKVLLTDHHAFGEEVAPHDVFIHPFKKNMVEENCGAYVAYMLAEAVLKRRDDYLLSLASLATVSDLMPLNLHNRNIIRLGLNYINNTSDHPFRYLYSGEFDAEVFSFQIAPKINAFGRVIEDTSINTIIGLFTNTNISKKYEISSQIEHINSIRKNMVNAVSNTQIIYDNEAVIVFDPSLKEGIVGLVCNKYLNQYKKPCIVLTKADDDVIKGSARSLNGTPLNEFFEQEKDLFLTCGGHANAGGLSLNINNLADLIEKFNKFVKNHPYKIELPRYIEIDNEDLTIENLNFVKSFAPFGIGFEEPTFKIKLSKNDVYLQNNLLKGNINKITTLIMFNAMNVELNDINEFYGKIKKDIYKNGFISFMVSAINL